MRYIIKGGVLIKSENAAKPCSQASSYLKSQISNFSKVKSSFDFGCGKLRYRKEMLLRSNQLVVVDSEIQLARMQKIGRQTTSIRNLSDRSNSLISQNVNEFRQSNQLFERGYCLNVLQVVPIKQVRDRMLRLIKSKLYPEGECLFAHMYRNSDFKRMGKMPNAKPWLDGFVVDSLRGFSFYGIIDPENLRKMIIEAGFEIQNYKKNDGSIYIVARNPSLA